eukprot:12274281-Alexandrium_andersonii.AAC.1
MSASLVGSEMCIRDSLCVVLRMQPTASPESHVDCLGFMLTALDACLASAHIYTSSPQWTNDSADDADDSVDS